MREKELALRYERVIQILTLLGKAADSRYTVVDAEDDYRSDPVRYWKLAEQVQLRFEQLRSQ